MVQAGSTEWTTLHALGWTTTDVPPGADAAEGDWHHMEPPPGGSQVMVTAEGDKCEQCQHPWHDGLCTCGGWGEDEERRAREWHEAHPDGLER
jgi:hypothetical protein